MDACDAAQDDSAWTDASHPDEETAQAMLHADLLAQYSWLTQPLADCRIDLDGDGMDEIIIRRWKNASPARMPTQFWRMKLQNHELLAGESMSAWISSYASACAYHPRLYAPRESYICCSSRRRADCLFPAVMNVCLFVLRQRPPDLKAPMQQLTAVPNRGGIYFGEQYLKKLFLG